MALLGRLTMSIIDLPELYQRSTHGYLDRVQQIRPEDWNRPTPCAGWTVRDLVNHVAYEDRWTPPLLGGSTIAEIGDRFDGDLLGDDPHGQALDSAKQAVDAVAAPGALNRTVHLSFGPTPAVEYAWQLLAEHLIHGWDLAAALDGSRRLDAELVRDCAQWFTGNEEPFRSAGAIGPRVDLPDSSSAQDQLLAAYGRDPNWSAAAP